MVTTRSTIRNLLEPGINAIVHTQIPRYPKEYTKIFSVHRSERAYEEDVTMSGFAAAATTAEGGGVTYDQARELWTSRYNHEKVTLGYTVTIEAIQDNQYGDIISKFTRYLVQSMEHTKETKGANILNNAFDNSYTYGDGVELCATNHPLGGGGTYANELATPADLSEASLEDMVIGISQFVDEKGLPMSVMPQKLIVPTQLQHEAYRILYSNGRPTTSDNDANALKEMQQIPEGFCVNHRLTDPDAFFIITNVMDGLKYFERMPLTTTIDGDFDTENTKVKMMERYAFGASDARGIYGSAGNS